MIFSWLPVTWAREMPEICSSSSATSSATRLSSESGRSPIMEKVTMELAFGSALATWGSVASCGNLLLARSILSLTWFTFSSMSAEASNSIRIVESPRPELEVRFLISLIEAISFSKGSVMRLSTSSGFAPGRNVATEAKGMLISGWISRGIDWIEKIPPMTMAMETIQATGRLRIRNDQKLSLFSFIDWFYFFIFGEEFVDAGDDLVALFEAAENFDEVADDFADFDGLVFDAIFGVDGADGFLAFVEEDAI